MNDYDDEPKPWTAASIAGGLFLLVILAVWIVILWKLIAYLCK